MCACALHQYRHSRNFLHFARRLLCSVYVLFQRDTFMPRLKRPLLYQNFRHLAVVKTLPTLPNIRINTHDTITNKLVLQAFVLEPFLEHLHSQESLCPYKWIRHETHTENKKTRIHRIVNRRRAHGKVSASIMGCHMLRVSFVSWAFGGVESTSRMTSEEIMKFTGHTSTRALERAYNRTQGVNFRKAYESTLGSTISSIMG